MTLFKLLLALWIGPLAEPNCPAPRRIIRIKINEKWKEEKVIAAIKEAYGRKLFDRL